MMTAWPLKRPAPEPKRKPRIHFAASGAVYFDGTWAGVVAHHGRGLHGSWCTRIHGTENWHLSAAAARAHACKELLRWRVVR